MKSVCTKIVLVLGLVLCFVPLHAQKNKFTSLKPAPFKVLIEQTVNPCIIDVRSSIGDFEAGHIIGAIHLDPADIQFILLLNRLNPETDTLFIYCKMGKTSKQAAQLIVSKGFKNVYSLKGGILAWEKSFPVVTD